MDRFVKCPACDATINVNAKECPACGFNPHHELERLKGECRKKEEELKNLLGGMSSEQFEHKINQSRKLYQSLAKRVLGPSSMAEIKRPSDETRARLSPNDRAAMLMVEGKYEQAEKIYEQLVAELQEQFGPDHPNLASRLNSLAGAYFARGKKLEAERLYRRAVKILTEKGDASHRSTMVSLLHNFASLLTSQDRLTEAEKIFSEVVAHYENAGALNGDELAHLLVEQASFCEKQGKLTEAEDCLKHALQIGPPNLKMWTRGSERGFSIYLEGTILSSLASLYVNQGRLEEAEKHCKRALALGTVQLGTKHPVMAAVLNSMARIREAQGRKLEAEEYRKRARLAKRE